MLVQSIEFKCPGFLAPLLLMPVIATKIAILLLLQLTTVAYYIHYEY